MDPPKHADQVARDALSRVRVVLVSPSHPGNIGAAARAIKVMGLSRLMLVAPKRFPDEQATAMASGAVDVLEAVTVTRDLDEALRGCVLAIATTSRARDLSHAVLNARDAALLAAQTTAQGEVAIVFGNETTGLANRDVDRCQRVLMIPANPDYASLNLAAAVQIVAYELRMAAGAATVPMASARHPASHEQMEGFFAQIEAAMIESRFVDPAKPKRLMTRLRRLFARSRLEVEEVNLLRGIVRALLEHRPRRRHVD